VLCSLVDSLGCVASVDDVTFMSEVTSCSVDINCGVAVVVVVSIVSISITAFLKLNY